MCYSNHEAGTLDLLAKDEVVRVERLHPYWTRLVFLACRHVEKYRKDPQVSLVRTGGCPT